MSLPAALPRLATKESCAKLDLGVADAIQAVGMAKRFATDAGFAVVDRALQLLGGYGYLRNHGVERFFCDARVHQLLEGTNRIMRLIIARRMLAP